MKTTATVLALLLAAPAAWACQNTSAIDAFANKIDRNNNGNITRQEWKKMYLNGQFDRDFKRGSPKVFNELDTDNNGKLSREELQALKSKVQYRHDSECEPDPVHTPEPQAPVAQSASEVSGQ